MTVPSQHIATSFGWASLGGYMTLAMSGVGSIVLARLLGPDEYGTYAVAASFSALIFVIASWGLPQVIIYLDLPTSQTVPAALLWAGALSLSAGAVLAATRVIFGTGHEVNWLITLVIICTRSVGMFADILYAPLEKELAYRRVSYWRTAANFVAFSMAVTAAGLSKSPWSLVLRDAVISFVSLSIVLYQGRGLAGPFVVSPAAFKKVVSLAARMWGGRSLEMVNQEGDAAMASRVLTAEDIGSYNRARFIAELWAFVTTRILSQVAYSSYCALNESRSRQQKMFGAINALLLHGGLLFAILATLFRRDICRLMLGKGWADVPPMVACLAVYAVVLPMFDHLRVFVTARGFVSKVILARSVQVVVFVMVLTFLHGRLLQLVAPIALTSGIAAAYLCLASQGIVPVRDLLKQWCSAGAAAVVVCVAGEALRQHLKSGPLPTAAGMFFTTLVWLGAVALVEQSHLRMMIRLVKSVTSPLEARAV